MTVPAGEKIHLMVQAFNDQECMVMRGGQDGSRDEWSCLNGQDYDFDVSDSIEFS